MDGGGGGGDGFGGGFGGGGERETRRLEDSRGDHCSERCMEMACKPWLLGFKFISNVLLIPSFLLLFIFIYLIFFPYVLI